jgi:hypothetical protein
VEKEEK